MYTVSEYLNMLRLAKRSEQTIKLYQKVLKHYAAYLDVPLNKVHQYLTPENLIKYAASLVGKSERTINVNLSILHRYFSINGIKFDSLQTNVIKARSSEEAHDKPLELENLQKMMDLASPQMKAILSVLVSTGMRAGELTHITLSDVKGDLIHIRNEIAKRKHGGDVYLTSEAREFLDIWLKKRNEYIRLANARHFSKNLPENDQRLFACSYPTLRASFARLYGLVDGEKGKYWNRCTVHSCRKYFRTTAVKTMPLDLVEKIMRHSGYLTNSYVRISNEEARKIFHDGETALYITRADHRIQGSKLDKLDRENKELRERLQRVENRESAIAALDRMSLSSADRDAIAKLVAEELRPKS